MSDRSAIRFFCKAKRNQVEPDTVSIESSPFIEHSQGGEELPRVASAFVAMCAEEQGHWSFDAEHLAVEFLRFLIQRHQQSREHIPPELLAAASAEMQASLLSHTNHGLRVVSDEKDLDSEIFEIHVSDVEPKGVKVFVVELSEEGFERVEWVE